MELIDTFGLGEFAETPVGALPTGTRRLAELVCTVALEPELVLLDEPSAGIAASESRELAEVLAGLRSRYSMTMVIIEHDLAMLSSVCDRMVALELGRVVASGTPEQVQRDPAVIESYMGTSALAINR